MGEDGARRVVVNSVGREIRTLDEAKPSKGRRVQLTLDASMQRAAEDGFRRPATGARRWCSIPRSGDVLTLVSLPAYDPNAFAVGHRSRGLAGAQHRRAASAAEPRHPGPILTRVDLQDRRRDGRARGEGRHARHEGVLRRRRRRSTAATSSATGRRPRLGRHAPRAREVVQRVLLHRRQHARRRPDPRRGRRSSAWPARAASTCRTRSRASSRRPSGSCSAPASGGIAGETISVSIGQGQVSVTPMSMAVMMASVAQGARVVPRLVQGHVERRRLGAGAGAASGLGASR